jgi:hypothetical protein
MSEMIQRIRELGHWEVRLRPGVYEKERIPRLSDCKSIIEENKVSYRGWDYPHYDRRNGPSTKLDHIEQSTEFLAHLEYWRYSQSGQFYHLSRLWEDAEHPPGQYLSIVSAIWTLTEIYEFAARLAVKGYLGELVLIDVTLHSGIGRQLAYFDSSRLLMNRYVSQVEELPRSVEVSAGQLAASAPELATDHAMWLFDRFDWGVPREGVEQDQERLLTGKF